MDLRWRWGTRFATALVITAVPVASGGLGPALTPTAQSIPAPQGLPANAPSPTVDLTALAPSVTTMQRHYVSRLPVDQRPQVIAPQTTIEAGLSLRTAADRNRKIAVSSTKGGPVFTASSLAEHDLPTAALRAYRNAAAEQNAATPGCHLPWTLLAGIGRVESDHGRYGGSVLGTDGVSHPAIIGVALDGKGPVAAIHDTDNGRYDGDKVWDRAVGPMQFIPSTWRGAGRDGDHDGVADPNDLDDAALATAGYLCHSGDLADESARRAAIMSYNASDYYVALVLAFERGYRTGVFIIPSPPVEAAPAPQPRHRAKGNAHHRAAHRTTAPRQDTKGSHETSSGTTTKPRSQPATTPTPTKSPAPKPVAKPTYTTVTGPLAGGGSSWSVGGKTFTTSGASGVAVSDFDGDGQVESLAAELAGVVARSGTATIRYQVGSSPLKVVALSVSGLAPPTPTASPQAAQATAASSTPSS
jgi:membrane-bound lytic murein transglycosylase B